MTKRGSSCVIFNKHREVLLVLREDFRVWGLPGGMVETEESWEEAAIREAREESGYEVEIMRYIGEFVRPQTNVVQRAYECRVVGGDPSQCHWESVDVRWFDTNALPCRMAPATTIMVRDALSEHPQPVQREVRFTPIQLLTFRVLVATRNFRNRYVHGPWSQSKNEN